MLIGAVAIVGVVRATVEPLEHRDFMRAAIEGLDGAFLVVILLELVNTTLTRGPVVQKVREFLVVGITSAVRTGLEVSAARGSDPHSVATNLVFDALSVLVLVVALRIIRERPDAERPPVP
jgi:hypothetical protein